MVFLLIIAFIVTSIYSGLKYYFKTTVWCRSQTCLVGKTAIITGANTGIGYETALDFAKRGARVILACRDQEKAEIARCKIIEETENKNIVVKIVDLASLKSVRNFAEDINDNEERLDILVNNAGAAGIGSEKTEDGLIWLMQVNYFSSFLLTNLLIGLLKKAPSGRIVNVSSKLAKRAKFNLEKINESTGHINNYACSKVCNILFTKELAERLRGTNITTYSLHPGTVQTEIFRHVKGHQKFIMDILKKYFLKTSEEGAQTVIYLGVQKNIESFNGEHFDNCEYVEPYKTTTDLGLPKKLWEKTEELIGLKPEEIQF